MFLDLSYNNISNISYLSSFRDLINCKLQGNNISGPIPSFFANMTKLEKLTFHEFPINGKPQINTSNPICQSSTYRQEVLDAVPQLMWLDGIPRGMEEFSCEFKDEDNDIKEKLNPNNFDFSFDGKIKLNQEDVLPKENIEIVKKIPLDKIIIETDAPYCEIKKSNEGFKYVETFFEGRLKKEKMKKGFMCKERNEPCTMIQVLEVVSKVKNVDKNEVAKMSFQNCFELFGLKNE
jgi:hypothetical protein